jgi:S-adenosylmethionine:tRNA ribosyltransferase-isomerase
VDSRFEAGDLLVVNDARVFPARFRLRRAGGGDSEVLLLEPCRGAAGAGPAWEAIFWPARWARRLFKRGEAVPVGGGEPEGAQLRVVGELEQGRFQVLVTRGGEALAPEAVIALCEARGEVPLPPYIERSRSGRLDAEDRERYQTVYARAPVAVAAPTAGLHFTPAILERLRERGVETATITHQIGLGTFQPIREDDIGRHRMHSEFSTIDEPAARAILRAREEGRRITAVGTTTVRALESFALAGTPVPHRARTELFIRPGHRFALVDRLLTNFHLPKSSLLVLVSAFAGRDLVLEAYRRAIEAGLRFYSYGDAMLVL